MKIAEAGHEVDLISVVPVKRSHSVCAQGGINGAVNTKGEGDSPFKHFDDTVYGGDFLAKVFQGRGFQPLLAHLRERFETVKLRKPDASRRRSAEVYVLARGYRFV